LQKKSETIYSLFPELGLLKDETLRNQVTDVLLECWQQSTWQDLKEVPIGPDYPPKYNFVNHTRSVTKNAIAIAKNLEEIHGVKVNMDYLIAIALLHDASKPLEFEKKGTECVRSRDGTLFPHSILASCMALRLGIPKEIAHSVLFHSPHQHSPPKNLEGLIVIHADLGDVDPIRVISGLKPEVRS